MTTTTPTHTNGHTPAGGVAALRALIDTKRDVLLAGAEADIRAGAAPSAPANLRTTLEAALDAVLAALDDPTTAAAWAVAQAGTPMTLSPEARSLVDWLIVVRQHCLASVSDAIEQGALALVPTLRPLLAAFDGAIGGLSAVFNQRRRIFEALVEQSVDGIIVSDMQTRVIYTNPAMARLTGRDQRESIGTTPDRYYPPDELARIAHEIVPAIMRDGVWSGDIRARRADGVEYTAYHSAVMLKDATGQPIALASYIRDVSDARAATERHDRLVEELRASNDRFEQSFCATPLATIEWDSDGIVRRWNPSAEQIFGWRADEAIGQNIIQLLVPNVALEHVQGVVAALLRGEAANSRNENVTKDGRIIVCQWYNAMLRDADGRVIGVLSQTEDITERVRNEEQLRIFQALVENAPDGIAVTTMDGTITYANQAFRQMYQRDDLLGTRFQELTTPEERQRGVAASRGLAPDESWRDIVQYARPDGSSFPGAVAGFRILDTAGRPQAIGAIVRDISEQVRDEQERLALREQVIAAQQAALRELSTPLIPLARGVVAMPLIGSIDSQRAQQVIQELLAGVAEHRARTAILDITGVPVVDTQVANALLRAAQAVKLLGAQVILTGIRPEVAQTLVGLGLDMTGLTTHSTLQSGIAAALAGAPARGAPGA